ncbi:cyanocobalamin reductase / alkylcobalamin dealkylase [Danio rerio]|uniref:Cyanocobalamin reductase / alkylcobalamin dealkylase n=1 Tax=Danio rerio TaxID=7955 RepID=MMAC_DANRE|nr:cyanocobalamin reductase / alkylcobalamin dealkylase [Danio rerio]Q5RFU5.2 RecName: Full=Cyanocobalamin reductase / alkylcobalamin dealkylase; AltName: Full=Alkylcobalamin:glutathione S-alkyltransferase; AltName: Full=CblC; AltName: Full=Cyanocobalamin reductase (cyanide-eliminating); AltName: Full=Methylmalonic aciduria and homocystinuria type C protein; Short=MMACHC [Danio rerio]|eukprot:NP_001108361.2 methylmalonic aciduria and homocystinuria type C protein homolog [Danio rerio]
MAISSERVEELLRTFRESLKAKGFEIYPFKVGWYNAVLTAAHHLQYPADTLAVLVISTPAMFECAFLPFLQSQSCESLRDPIDQCTAHTLSACISLCFANQFVDVSYDYEMLPSRKPKFLAQTAAHVSGAAYYYQTSDIHNPPWGEKKMFGVCVHPQLGGWFAIRALLVFRDVQAGAGFQQRDPADCVCTQEERIRLLESFNLRWRDWSYRDIVPAEDRYSDQQKQYFITPPGQRRALLRQWGYLTDTQS